VTWHDRPVTTALGWAGSALLVHSLLQTRVLRFRVLNLLAAAVLIVFNALIGVWSMVAMNAVIAVINIWHAARLVRGRHDDLRYEVVPIGAEESYLRSVLARHRADIERFNPALNLDHATLRGVGPVAPQQRLAFLVLASGETVGVVLAHRTDVPGEAQVDLDYVLPRFRDFTPGEFLYRRGGPFLTAGVHRLLAPPQMREADRYLRDVGFRPEGGALVLDLADLAA